MSTDASQFESNDDDRGEEGAKQDGGESLRKAEGRAESELREFFRELRKQSARGAAFEAGREAFKEIVRLLTEDT